MHKASLRISTREKRNLIYSSYNSTKNYVLQKEQKDSQKGKVSNLKEYWFSKYINYIKNYEATLDRNFPKTMRFYRIFRNGTKEFFLDLRRYISLIKKQNLDGLNDKKREEIELAYRMPKDLLKISPVLLISMLPFTNYIIFPLAYYFPRQLLTYHFWTAEQRKDFMIVDHKKKFKYSRPLFHCMKMKVNYINDRCIQARWSGIIACLGSGGHPTTESVISCSNLFSSLPYSLEMLTDRHMKQLLGIHGLPIWRPFKRRRLIERGTLLKQMDDAIIKEGGVINMSEESLCWALSFRGLNSANMPVQNMRKWLKKWIILSSSVDDSKLSLLLHAPILLAYNHANNLKILYK